MVDQWWTMVWAPDPARKLEQRATERVLAGSALVVAPRPAPTNSLIWQYRAELEGPSSGS